MHLARVPIVAALFSLAWVFPALSENPEEPFNVSLWSLREANLSAYYQRIVGEATERYRGDLNGRFGAVVLRTIYNGAVIYSRNIRLPDQVPSASSIKMSPEFEEDFDRFPKTSFALHNTAEDRNSYDHYLGRGD
jgi:hypothetical protein